MAPAHGFRHEVGYAMGLCDGSKNDIPLLHEMCGRLLRLATAFLHDFRIGMRIWGGKIEYLFHAASELTFVVRCHEKNWHPGGLRKFLPGGFGIFVPKTRGG